MPLHVNVTLSLPRDELTVPVVRHLFQATMDELGVTPTCRGDIILALSEACTNVVDHSVDGHDYQVDLSIDERECVISVTDKGGGFDVEDRGGIIDLSESGRGIGMMHALVDSVSFTSVKQEGTTVRLAKDLEFLDDHPVSSRLLQT